LGHYLQLLISDLTKIYNDIKIDEMQYGSGHVAPLGHNILIPSQPIFALTTRPSNEESINQLGKSLERAASIKNAFLVMVYPLGKICESFILLSIQVSVPNIISGYVPHWTSSKKQLYCNGYT
jgi:hypothetical protein